jgi:AcrR family transcriptional regulator
MTINPDDETRATGLPASIDASWGMHDRPTRGPKPVLSLARIVQAAVKLAESEGLQAVSMSRVARELGSSAMSLYRYVAAKDELLMLMVDAAAGPPPAADPDEGWREGLTRWSWAYHDVLRRHSWIVRIPITAPPPLPNQVAWMEDCLRSMGATGLAEGEKASVLLLLSGFVRNEAILTADLEANFLAAAASPDEAMSGYSSLLRRLTDAERFPALHAVLAAGVFDVADDPDDEFRFGLERILDGVDALISSRLADR